MSGWPEDNNSPHNCPSCRVSLMGDPIPENIRKHYSGTHWKREIGIDGGYLGIYDGIVAYRCPDCAHEWARGGSTWARKMFDQYQKIKAGELESDFDPFEVKRG